MKVCYCSIITIYANSLQKYCKKTGKLLSNSVSKQHDQQQYVLAKLMP